MQVVAECDERRTRGNGEFALIRSEPAVIEHLHGILRRFPGSGRREVDEGAQLILGLGVVEESAFQIDVVQIAHSVRLAERDIGLVEDTGQRVDAEEHFRKACHRRQRGDHVAHGLQKRANVLDGRNCRGTRHHDQGRSPEVRVARERQNFGERDRGDRHDDWPDIPVYGNGIGREHHARDDRSLHCRRRAPVEERERGKEHDVERRARQTIRRQEVAALDEIVVRVILNLPDHGDGGSDIARHRHGKRSCQFPDQTRRSARIHGRGNRGQVEQRKDLRDRGVFDERRRVEVGVGEDDILRDEVEADVLLDDVREMQEREWRHE